MNQGIVQADKKLRKRFFIFLGLSVIAVLIIVPYFNEYLEQIKQISEKNPELAFKKYIFALKVSLGLVSILLLSMGVYSVLLARKILRSDQYPPPGMRVIKDTRLRTGTQARRAAIFLIVLSCVLVVLAFFFLYWPYAFEKTLLKKKSSDTKRGLLGKEKGVIGLKEEVGHRIRLSERRSSTLRHPIR